jgi:flagellar assembly protein FliH
MALIRNAQAREIARDAMVLDLSDVSRQGEAIIQSAKQRAEQIVAEAVRERTRLLAGASEEGRKAGFEKGYADGHAKGTSAGREAAVTERRESLAKLESAWNEALTSFASQRDAMTMQAERDILKLACMMASKVTRRAVELDASVVERQVAAVLSQIVRPTDMVLRVHPEDREVAQGAVGALLAKMSSVRHVELMDDASLSRGSCVATCRGAGQGTGEGRDASPPGGELDASINAQIDRIVSILLPGDESTKASVTT